MDKSDDNRGKQGSVVIEREERMVIIRVGGVSREGVRLVRIECVSDVSGTRCGSWRG